MTHDDALKLENSFRKLNGTGWERSADAIECNPASEIRKGLLEYLLGNNVKAKAFDLIIRLSLEGNDTVDVDEVHDLINELA